MVINCSHCLKYGEAGITKFLSELLKSGEYFFYGFLRLKNCDSINFLTILQIIIIINSINLIVNL